MSLTNSVQTIENIQWWMYGNYSLLGCDTV